ncbi:MAG: tetratricopeptide repeat protein [Pseudomonadota bacterium]
MLKLASKVPRALSSRRNVTLFSPKLFAQSLPLVFPLHSNVIDDCGVTFSINNNVNSLASLKHSFIPFHEATSTYTLTPRTFKLFDKKITDLANMIESVSGTLFKLVSLLGLKYTMEILPQLFSWQEYYAIAEYTAITLLNCGYTGRAIDLIKRVPSLALHAYRPEISRVDPIFWSANELLTLAYLLKGDYQQAEKFADRLIASVQEPAIKDYQARAMTIKALIHYVQGNYDESIYLQEQAIKLLKGPRNTALQAVVIYDLWVFHRMLNHNKQAEEIYKTLESLMKKLDDPLSEQIRSFIKYNIDESKIESTKYQP